MPEVPSAVRGVVDELYKCNRCGFCQTRCPVYRLTGKEASVARGHSARLRAVLEGELPLDGALRGAISECLMCRACTAECPPAIETDRIIVAARTAYTARRQSPLQRLIFRRVLCTRRGLLGLGVRAFRLLKRTGLASAASLLRYLPWGRGLASAPQLMPTPASFLRDRVPAEARAKAAQVTYFVGCAIEFALPEVGEATLQVLRAAGMSAKLGDNVCCGLPPYSYGDVAAATALARRNLEALAGEGVLLTDCGSCSSFLKEYPQLFAADSPERGRADSLSGRVRDATEFLLDLDLPELLPVPAVVTYHDPCHLSRYQKLAPQARRLARPPPRPGLPRVARGGLVLRRARGATASRTPRPRDRSSSARWRTCGAPGPACW